MSSFPESEEPWESYNQWQCFSAKNLDFDCAYYDDGILVPSITVETDNEIFLFDTYVEDRLDCKKTLTLWQGLTDDGQEFCIFAAHMPDVEWGEDENRHHSLWYIRRVKGVRGYWDLYESSPENTTTE